MREFAKAFYESPAWRSTRAYILKRDAGLCVRCGALGVIVHHKRPLTPGNIDDPLVSLNENNLETLCRACHAIAHGAAPPIADGLAFDENGNVVEAALMPRQQIDDDEFY
ncbi:MAG: HNH endonuclease [Lachnospiraceae bacterium]|nr:HNH endonuclease [Lachnospiraceae bacterium]